jgi:hypothetical protein
MSLLSGNDRKVPLGIPSHIIETFDDVLTFVTADELPSEEILRKLKEPFNQLLDCTKSKVILAKIKEAELVQAQTSE